MNLRTYFESLKKRYNLITFLLGGFVFITSFLFTCRGIVWSTFIHPDEIAITRFHQDISKNDYLTLRAYPTGWFSLVSICEAITKPIKNFERNWGLKTTQVGSIDSLNADTFVVDTNYGKINKELKIQDGRNINLVLHSFAALFIFLAIIEAGLHPVSALFAGLLLGTHAMPVEFAHYCETDTALVFSLSLFAWAITAAIRRKSTIHISLSMLAAGFAFSCKFTLAPLILFIPTCTCLQCYNKSYGLKKVIRYAPLFLIFFALLFLFGFLYGIPTAYRDTAFFFKSVKEIGYLTYLETTRTLGAFADVPGMKTKFRFATMMDEIPEVGIMTLVWLVISFLIVSFIKPFRKYLLGLPLFLISFGIFACFGMPWIRSQELLPIVVSIAFLSAFPITFAIKNIQAPIVSRKIYGIAICLIGFITLTLSIINGNRMLSAFENREPVAECQNWLRQSIDPTRGIAFDRYVAMVSKGILGSHYSIGRVDQNYPNCLQDQTNSISMFVRNKYFIGREPNRHPSTRELLPDAQKSVNRFIEECTLLKTWEPIFGTVRPVFNQATTELWYIPQSTNSPMFDLPIHYERPIYCRLDRIPFYGSWQRGPFGPDYGLLISKKYSSFHPQYCPTNKTWFVVRSLSSKEATINAEDFLVPNQSKVLPNQAKVFSIDSNKLAFAGHFNIRPKTKVTSEKRHGFNELIGSTTATPSEAAFLLRKYGNPKGALEFLKDNGINNESEKLEAFMAAKECGLEVKSEWVEAARNAVLLYEKALEIQEQGLFSFTITGVPADVATKFSNLRFTPGEAHIQIFRGDYDIIVKFNQYIPQKATEIPFLTVQRTPAKKISNHEVKFKFTVEKTTDINYIPSIMGQDFWGEFAQVREIEIKWDPLQIMEKEVEEIKRHLN